MEEAFSNPKQIISQVSISEGSKVVDVGTGFGYYAFLMSELVGTEGSVYAIDVHKNILETLDKTAKEKGIKNITTVWGNIESVNGSRLRDSSIDFVVMANVLFQLEDKEAGIKEIRRILNSIGTILLIDWQDSFGGLGPQSSQVVDSTHAVLLFEQLGFSKVKDIEAGSHHYGILFKKIANL